MLSGSPIGPTLPTTDMDRSRAFYEGKLGLEVWLEIDFATLYRCGGGTFLSLYRRDAPADAGQTAAIWFVDDVEATVRDLAQKDVVFERYDLPFLKTDDRGIAEADGRRSAWFKDPDGNVLSIAERPAPRGRAG